MSDESVFAEAVAIPDPADRAAYLDRACADNPALRREVEGLLAAHTAAGDFLAGPAAAVPTARYVEPDRVGGRLGLFTAKASFEKAHDEMLAIVPPEDAHEFHVNLIRHGRAVCRPKPRCGECALRRMCPWYREDHAGGSMRAAS